MHCECPNNKLLVDSDTLRLWTRSGELRIEKDIGDLYATSRSQTFDGITDADSNRDAEIL